MDWIGRTVTPGEFSAISRKEMPRCALTKGSVRTSVNSMSAMKASEVQIFWPLTT